MGQAAARPTISRRRVRDAMMLDTSGAISHCTHCHRAWPRRVSAACYIFLRRAPRIAIAGRRVVGRAADADGHCSAQLTQEGGHTAPTNEGGDDDSGGYLQMPSRVGRGRRGQIGNIAAEVEDFAARADCQSRSLAVILAIYLPVMPLNTVSSGRFGGSSPVYFAIRRACFVKRPSREPRDGPPYRAAMACRIRVAPTARRAWLYSCHDWRHFFDSSKISDGSMRGVAYL